MKWYSTENFFPGNEYIPSSGYLSPEFIVIYHHGDEELMINIALWDGNKFIIGSNCFCEECDCDCIYQKKYSEECQVTHWSHIEIPEFNMEIYFDE